MQVSQMERERILIEQKNFHEYLEKEADQDFQGDLVAQARVSEALAELDRREW